MVTQTHRNLWFIVDLIRVLDFYQHFRIFLASISLSYANAKTTIII